MEILNRSIDLPVDKHTHIVIILLLFGLSLLFTSCLKEPVRNCPPQYRILLSVKDKNYSNISEIPQITPENDSLPFREFVGDLAYQLRNLTTGELLLSASDATIGGDDKIYIIDFNEIPTGHYGLTVMGNLVTAPHSKAESSTFPLHLDTREHTDVYIAYDIIDFSSEPKTGSLAVSRTKGDLAVSVQNLPDSVARIDIQVNAVYQEISEQDLYQGESVVIKTFTDSLKPSVLLQTLLAPTVTGKKSALRISLFTAGKDTPYIILPDVEITIKRNEITMIDLNLKPQGGYEISIWQEGAWIKLHDMDITLRSLKQP